MRQRVVIAGLVLALAIIAVLAFTPAGSALANLADRGDGSCVTKTRTKDEIRKLAEETVPKLEKAGWSHEQAEKAFDPGMFAATTSICSER